MFISIPFLMKVIWTIEQVAGLAPTNHLLKTSRSFAFAEKWLTLGQNGQTAWGIFPLSKEKARILLANYSESLCK